MNPHFPQGRSNHEVNMSRRDEYYGYPHQVSMQQATYQNHQNFGYAGQEFVGSHVYHTHVARPTSPLQFTAVAGEIIETRHEQSFAGAGHQRPTARGVHTEADLSRSLQSRYRKHSQRYQQPKQLYASASGFGVVPSAAVVAEESIRKGTISPLAYSPQLPPVNDEGVQVMNTQYPEFQHSPVRGNSWNVFEQYFHLDQEELSLTSSSDLSIELTMVDTSGGSLGGRTSVGVDDIVDQVASSVGMNTTTSHSRPSSSASRRSTHSLSSQQGPSLKASYSSMMPYQQQPLRSLKNKADSQQRHWGGWASSSGSSSRSRSRNNRMSKGDAQPQTLTELIERKLIAEWARKEQDSRCLQKLLRAANRRERHLALNQIAGELVDLSCHIFGNYVIQKFLEYGLPEQRDRIVSTLKNDFVLMSQDQYGCRVVQKAIELSEMPIKLTLLDHLSDDLATLVACQHGNHVVQKLVLEIPADKLTAVYKVFDGRVVGHCVQMYGCRVVQRLFAHATPAFKDRMTTDILEHGLYLAKDTWGNYVVQYIIEKGNRQVVKRIVDMLLDNFEELSFDKLASNVVEKCLEFATSSSIDAFVKVLLHRSNEEFVEFLTHDYGNYVVQTMIDRANFKQGAYKINRRLKKYGLMQAVKSETAGRRVAAKLDEKLSEYQKSRERCDSRRSWD